MCACYDSKPDPQRPEEKKPVNISPIKHSVDSSPFNNNKEKKWAIGCHLIALCGCIIPFGHLLGPFIIWIFNKDEMPLVDKEGRKVLNFQLTMTIYLLIAGLLCFILIGFLLLPLVVITDIISIIVGAYKTSEKKDFKYPFSMEFIK